MSDREISLMMAVMLQIPDVNQKGIRGGNGTIINSKTNACRGNSGEFHTYVDKIGVSH